MLTTSQLLSNPPKKKPTHSKNQTLPNAAVLLLNEILLKNGEAFNKIQSTKETPRIDKSNFKNKSFSKPNIPNIRKASQVSSKSNQRQAEVRDNSVTLACDNMDFNEIEVGIELDNQ